MLSFVTSAVIVTGKNFLVSLVRLNTDLEVICKHSLKAHVKIVALSFLKVTLMSNYAF